MCARIVKVTDSYNLSSKDLKKLIELVSKNKDKLKGEWDGYFTEK